MKEFVSVIECGFAAMGGYLGWAMGGFDGFLYALVVFVAVDYVTGLMAAAVEKKNGSAVWTAVIFFYLSNEGISILENAARIGLPVSEKLKGVLA